MARQYWLTKSERRHHLLGRRSQLRHPQPQAGQDADWRPRPLPTTPTPSRRVWPASLRIGRGLDDGVDKGPVISRGSTGTA